MNYRLLKALLCMIPALNLLLVVTQAGLFDTHSTPSTTADASINVFEANGLCLPAAADGGDLAQPFGNLLRAFEKKQR